LQMEVSFPGGKKVDVSFNGFTVHTDQSVMGGGEGSAPEPFAYFLASLATCAGIYVLGFCQKRNINTDGLKLLQRAMSDPSGERPLSKVEIEIILPANFPEKYKDAVVKTAELCTVKRVIDSPPKFKVYTSTNAG